MSSLWLYNNGVSDSKLPTELKLPAGFNVCGAGNMCLVKSDADEHFDEMPNFCWSFAPPNKSISADQAIIFTDKKDANQELVKVSVAEALDNLGVSPATAQGAPDLLMYGFKGTVTTKKAISLKAIHSMVAIARKPLLPAEATFGNAGVSATCSRLSSSTSPSSSSPSHHNYHHHKWQPAITATSTSASSTFT